jgi:cyclopropane fatty-acyl-phospholipid synthase-like methyltransferase
MKEFNSKYKKQIMFLENEYQARWGNKSIPINLLKNIYDFTNKESRILEIGCNQGYNLQFLKKIGYENLYGLDSSNHDVSKGKSKFLNINIFNVDITSELINTQEKFDVIFSKSTLQHIEFSKIDRLFDRVFNNLNKQGMFIFQETVFMDPANQTMYEKILRQDATNKDGTTIGSRIFCHNYFKLVDTWENKSCTILDKNNRLTSVIFYIKT